MVHFRKRFTIGRLMAAVAVVGVHFALLPWPACAILAVGGLLPVVTKGLTLVRWATAYISLAATVFFVYLAATEESAVALMIGAVLLVMGSPIYLSLFFCVLAAKLTLADYEREKARRNRAVRMHVVEEREEGPPVGGPEWMVAGELPPGLLD